MIIMMKMILFSIIIYIVSEEITFSYLYQLIHLMKIIMKLKIIKIIILIILIQSIQKKESN